MSRHAPARHLPSLAAARPALRELHAQGGSIGSIHTLGALHAGHARVIEMAAAENDHVVVSVYPNRAQLAPGSRYAYDLEADIAFAGEHGATHVISSHDEEIYPAAYRTFLRQEPAMNRLDAVAVDYLYPGMITMSVRWILFVRPHRTYWGLKDIGQTILVRRALEDLLVDVELREVPCVRYRSGIPISSRLLRLDRDALVEVQKVHRALEGARVAVAEGETSAAAVLDGVRADLSALERFRIAYAQLVSPVDFAVLQEVTVPFILHVAITDGTIFHFDGHLIRSHEELRDGAPVVWLDQEWPCAESVPV